ncbi:MAG TPA: extracellular solute-binding protein [Beijerinckiaceae bacterium]|nr:extracellular solute-binding protein [Beijerinckiaceae bacterium]
MISRRVALAAAALSVALAGAAHGQAPSGKVTVVTSFSKEVTDPFKAAFEKAFPGTTLEVQNRNTNAGVKFIEETKSNNGVDLFWASAPDAFEVLKAKGLLEAYKPKADGIPDKIGHFPINDPQGFYSGFAASGYGIMWNDRYVKANKLPEPKEWEDLATAPYFDHVSMAAPSRSGTTHLTIEAILQSAGWEKGWGIVKAFSGNLRGVTERSFGVPDAVNSGQVGYGIVIDFFGFSAQGAGFPVKFVYPSLSTIVPANIGVVKNAPNAAGAKAFVDFILSEPGQAILFDPKIRRLPVRTASYAKAPAGLPNPFEFKWLADPKSKFDVEKSEKRFAAVDALYDQLVTFQHEALKAATKAIHDADAAIARKPSPEASRLVAEARALVARMPVSEAEAASPEMAAAFTGGKEKGPRQAELEQKWAAYAKENYAAALAKAQAAQQAAK